jgi:hypothetical protein
VSTPEGRLAHSIKVPDPVPKDSGYRKGMTAEQYFHHLCKTQAGEFIYRTAENVDGFQFMRPPKRPTDQDLKDRYNLEAPEIERPFQLMRDTPAARAALFVNPPWNRYKFVEELSFNTERGAEYRRSSGYRQGESDMNTAVVSERESVYGITWRGVRRHPDRELSIAGGEWIVLDLTSGQVLAVMRTFGLSPKVRNSPQQIWWLNATQCPGGKKPRTAAHNAMQLYDFISRTLKPRWGKRP